MSDLRPFGMRVLVVPVEDTLSNVALPPGVRLTDLSRGLVVAGPREGEDGGAAQMQFAPPWRCPPPGSVIYYWPDSRPPCWQIGDQTVVPYEAIVAVQEQPQP